MAARTAKRAPAKLAPTRRAPPKKKADCARDATLEALIDANPDDPQVYLVYADWLQQQGDVRGELIGVQHRASLRPESNALHHASANLLRKHRRELFGSALARYTTAVGPSALAWRWGFVHAARLTSVRDLPLVDLVAGLFDHPSGRFVRHLYLGVPRLGRFNGRADFPPVFARLAKAPSTLDTLLLGYRCEEIRSIAPLWEAMPRLRSLGLLAAVMDVGQVRAPALEELRLELHRDAHLAKIAAARWPRVERLEVRVNETRKPASLASLIEAEVTPSLRELTLRSWVLTVESIFDVEGAPIAKDDLVLTVVERAARLRRLELEVPLSARGAGELVKRKKDLRHLESIRIPVEAVADRSLRAKLSNALPNLQWVRALTEGSLADMPGEG